ncbi:hypothetical protein BT96DRAFT_924900 [Gymnopus androsaceus JB14]|uniref:CFEM domain-containing protein n=1 Tax=Gymnopus androsaceus JB14 TaxID=1447944 RepID=A0A6A4H1J7_9AGAR|nr:hypothetical protein BT96DRAFT_924900 [Gymnopus androsaceus JB14]
MRVSLLLLAVVTSTCVSASIDSLFSRQLSNLPTCAIPCLTATTTTTFGNCSSTDEACLCNNSQFISTTTSCVEGACTGNDLQTALQAAQGLCASAGVTLDISSIASSVSATGTASATSSAATTSSSSSAALSNFNMNEIFARLLCLVGAGVLALLAL